MKPELWLLCYDVRFVCTQLVFALRWGVVVAHENLRFTPFSVYAKEWFLFIAPNVFKSANSSSHKQPKMRNQRLILSLFLVLVLALLCVQQALSIDKDGETVRTVS